MYMIVTTTVWIA